MKTDLTKEIEQALVRKELAGQFKTAYGALEVPCGFNSYLNLKKENVDFAIKNIGLIKTSENEEIFEFVYLYLKSKEMKNYIESRLAGSTQQYISLNELRNIPIILPKKEILTKFKKIIKSIFEQITIDIREESNLIHLRDTLLPKLMSGEIRVPID